MDEREKSFETRLGTFTLRRETALDQLKIGRRRRALLGGTDADGFDWNFAHQLSTIDVLSEGRPDDLPIDRKTGFIDWDKIYDIDSILVMWKEHQEWENSFLESNSNSGDEGGISGQE